MTEHYYRLHLTALDASVDLDERLQDYYDWLQNQGYAVEWEFAPAGVDELGVSLKQAILITVLEISLGYEGLSGLLHEAPPELKQQVQQHIEQRKPEEDEPNQDGKVPTEIRPKNSDPMPKPPIDGKK